MAQTYGKAKANIWNSKAYFKPSLHKLVIRAVGVNRKSEEVMARNRAFAAMKPAAQCKGKDWPAFVSCLKAVTSGRKVAAVY